jgi:hypothetical protein
VLLEQPHCQTYGVEVSADTSRAITDKIWLLVKAWQNRPLRRFIPLSIWTGFMSNCVGKTPPSCILENVAVYIVIGVDLEGHRVVLGHWLGDGAAPRRQRLASGSASLATYKLVTSRTSSSPAWMAWPVDLFIQADKLVSTDA